MVPLMLQAGVFLLAVAITGLVNRQARRHRLLAYPVSRSAHVDPTPAMGGIAIVLLFLAMAVLALGRNLLSSSEFLALMAGVLVAVVGLLDDFWQLSIYWRMLSQCLATAWVLALLGPLPSLDFWVFTLDATWLLYPAAGLMLLWLLNLYNFMDGIDGLAAIELISVTVLSSFFAITGGDQALALLCASLASAAAGFLVWNWPPAKIFMGDVGSSFIGFTLGILALMSVLHGTTSLWTWFILLAVFVVDATTTLVRRMASGEVWYEGHASHAYQNAARRYKSHAKVTITVLLINCFWLAPLAWFSVQWPEYGFPLTILSMTPLLFLAIKLRAGNNQ